MIVRVWMDTPIPMSAVYRIAASIKNIRGEPYCAGDSMGRFGDIVLSDFPADREPLLCEFLTKEMSGFVDRYEVIP